MMRGNLRTEVVSLFRMGRKTHSRFGFREMVAMCFQAETQHWIEHR